MLVANNNSALRDVFVKGVFPAFVLFLFLFVLDGLVYPAVPLPVALPVASRCRDRAATPGDARLEREMRMQRARLLGMMMRTTSSSTTSREGESYAELANSIDRLLLEAAQAMCSRHTTAVLPNGAWCLLSHAPKRFYAPGRELSREHLAVDAAVAKGMRHLARGHSVVDLGAGLGQYGDYFDDYTAFDGAINVEAFTKDAVCWADLTLPFTLAVQRDIVISTEVGEHIPREFQEVFVENLVSNARCCVFTSWAVPGQGGHSHVNELSNADVQSMFEARGFSRRVDLDAPIRAAAQYAWFKNTFMIYCRRETQCT